MLLCLFICTIRLRLICFTYICVRLCCRFNSSGGINICRFFISFRFLSSELLSQWWFLMSKPFIKIFFCKHRNPYSLQDGDHYRGRTSQVCFGPFCGTEKSCGTAHILHICKDAYIVQLLFSFWGLLSQQLGDKCISVP